jgi:RNA polymerase sigma-70 factor, ECF subfamily
MSPTASNDISMAADDADLLLEISRTRSHRAFQIIFERHYNHALALAHCICRSTELAESAVQAALLRVWMYASSFKSGNAPKWIMTIVAREAIKHLKQRQKESSSARLRRVDLIEVAKPVADPDTDDELAIALSNALADLPAEDRQIVTMYYAASMQLHEIGSSLDLSRQTVAYRLKKSLDRMRAHLTKAGYAICIPMLETSDWVSAALLHVKFAGSGASITFTALCAKMTAQAAAISLGIKAACIAAMLTLIAVLAGIGYSFKSVNPVSSEKAYFHAVARENALVVPVNAALSHTEHISPGAGSSEPKLFRRWDFEDLEVPEDIRAVAGSWKQIRFNGRGQMLTPASGARVLLDIDIKRLPVLVTMKTSVAGRQAAYVMQPAWCSALYRCEIKNIYPTVVVSYIGTHLVEVYITEEYMDTRINGIPSTLYFEKRKPGSKLELQFSGDIRIDEVAIREIKAQGLPDYSHYKQYFDQLSPDQWQQYAKIPVPGLESKCPPAPVQLLLFKTDNN